MDNAANNRTAARERLKAVIEAFDYPDPDDYEAMVALHTANHRLAELVASAIVRDRLRFPRTIAARVPEVDEGGPTTAAQAVLWEMGVRYERTASLIEVFVGEERLLTYAVSSLRQKASVN